MQIYKSSLFLASGRAQFRVILNLPAASFNSQNNAKNATLKRNDLLIETEELDKLISKKSEDLKILNGSWHMPNMNRDPWKDHISARIPGAVFFDIDAISDHNTDLPHMLPTESEFAIHMYNLGVRRTDNIVCYDDVGIFSSPRVAWTMRFFGAERVRLLNGGMKKWLDEKRKVESGKPEERKTNYYPSRKIDGDYNYKVVDESIVVRDYKSMNKVVVDHIKNDKSKIQVIDARAPERWAGKVEEPRPGMRKGNVQGSLNVFFKDLVDEKTGTFKSEEDLKKLFKQANFEFQSQKKTISYCGSGITACMVDMTLKLLGEKNTGIYDGSWAEYGLYEDPKLSEEAKKK